MADVEGSGCATRLKGDVDDDDSRLNAEAQRSDTGKGEGAHGGSGEGWSHQTNLGDYQRHETPRMDGDGFRCKILDRITWGYTCSHCPGGRNYSICCRIRGVEK